MHATYHYHQSRWFPMIGVRFDRFADLLIAFTAAIMVIIILGLALASTRRILVKAVKHLGIFLLGIMLHLGIILAEISTLALLTIKQIPLSWYPVVALTIVPMTIDIPRQGMIWFLLAYCLSNGWIVAFGFPSPKSTLPSKIDPPRTPTHKNTSNLCQPTASDNIQPNRVQSHLFTGMRISIQ